MDENSSLINSSLTKEVENNSYSEGKVAIDTRVEESELVDKSGQPNIVDIRNFFERNKNCKEEKRSNSYVSPIKAKTNQPGRFTQARRNN